jgi:FMN phosphatase YigB (HAD superfamily)
MLVVFDIDGTLANSDHRAHHWKQKPRNWAAINAGIIDDAPIPAVVKIAQTLYDAGNTVVMCTARSENTRRNTEAWFEHVNIEYDQMFMREDGDYRDDWIIKKELLDLIIETYGKKPDMVFDDRPSVVKMWREEGIFVLDVYQGEEDF